MSDDMRDLIERLERASAELQRLAAKEHNWREVDRLRAKSEGVRLARSYAKEYMR